MGGATAVMHALRHPDLFCVAASIGGAFEAASRLGDPYADLRVEPEMLMPSEADHNRTWGPAGSETRLEYDPFRLLRARGRGLVSALYIDVGIDDHARILHGNRRLHHELDELGVSHSYTERPGGHAWEYIRDALPQMLRFVADHVDVRDTKPALRTAHVGGRPS
jgi:S-formylglutathione hydrolase FrmB